MKNSLTPFAPFTPGRKESRATDLPAVVAEGRVLVAKIGATVAAATGVPVLKMVFCGGEPHKTVINKNISLSIQSKSNHRFHIARSLASCA